MANGDGNGNGVWKDMPWWVKAVAIVGVPSLISLGVVWSDRVQLAAKTYENNVFLRQVIAESGEHNDRVLQRFEALGNRADETNRILLAGCINDAQKAKNPIEAQERCVGRR